MTKRFRFVPALAAAALLGAGATPASAAPRLEFEYAQPPYTIAATCDPAQPLVVLNIVLRNTGDAASAGPAIGAADAAGVLAGALTLPPVAPGATVDAHVGLRRVASNTGALGGSRTIVVTLNQVQLAPLTLALPAAFCAGQTIVRGTGGLQPAGARAAQLARTGLPTPADLHYTTNEATCIAHGGGSIACETLRTAHAVALYWSSDACAACTVSGYRLRMPGTPPGALVDTSTARIAVEQMPKSGWSGACYVVTSYSEPVVPMVLDGTGRKIPLPGATPGGTRAESAPSRSLCIGATQRDVAVTPAAARNYVRTYWKNYQTDNAEHVKDDQPRDRTDFQVGFQYLTNPGSQTNIFYRGVAAFDRPAIGQATIFGGALTYNVDKTRGGTMHFCLRTNTPAPAGWESSTWPALPEPALPTATQTGLTLAQPVDAWLRNWTTPSRITFLLSGTDYAEQVRSSVEGRSFSCYANVTNLRLLVSVGVDQ